MTGFIFGAIVALVVGRIIRGDSSDFQAIVDKVMKAI